MAFLRSKTFFFNFLKLPVKFSDLALRLGDISRMDLFAGRESLVVLDGLAHQRSGMLWRHVPGGDAHDNKQDDLHRVGLEKEHSKISYCPIDKFSVRREFK